GYTDVDTNAYFQIEFDRKYNFKTFIVHWGKLRDVPRSPSTYDISVSEDGVNWVLAADNHSMTSSKATHDDTSIDVVGKYIRIHDFNGYYSFTKSIDICELQAYGEVVPAEETFTGDLMLNLYNQINIEYSYDVPYVAGGRNDVIGAFVGTTTDRGFQSRRLGTVIAQALYPDELNLDRIEISIGLRGNSYTNNASRIEYTNSTSEGWAVLVDNIDFDAGVDSVAAATNLFLNTDFFVDTVQGLRWVMPADNWHTNINTVLEFGEPLTPQLYRLNAYGTNTVPVDYRLNIINAEPVAITTNGAWSTTTSSMNFSELNDQIGYEYASNSKSGAASVNSNAYLQIEFDRQYQFKTFIVHWAKVADVPYAPQYYDISVSEDGINWTVVADDHPVTEPVTTHDSTAMDIAGKYIRIHGFTGYYGFSNYIRICELQAYGDILPAQGTCIFIQ
ncbi:MAG: discoidin domain-containing protein, partial [Bacteroidales bacterium]|nr:discoidin domain-containing protein [Bacteroidales bacterium]